MKLGDIRDRLMPMIEDAHWAETILEKEDNQFTRRVYIRSLFAMIEGVVWVLKETVLKTPTRSGRFKRLTVAEYVLLSDKTYELKSNGDPKVQTKFLKLPDNIRFTFKVLNKYFGVNLDLGVGTVVWDNFLVVQAIRNRIMHPKMSNEFEISNEDIVIIKEVCSWFNELLSAFFNGLLNNSNQQS